MRRPLTPPLLPLAGRAATLLALLLPAGPAWAGLAADTFQDVPPGHWAETGVAEVAIQRDLMQGYPDLTFRGDEAFTRLQFAQSLRVLVRDLERSSRTSWAPLTGASHAFTDLSPEVSADVELVADRYALFEGVPAVEPTSFGATASVTRYEMAKVINNLMRLAEARDVVRPVGEASASAAFTDASPEDWAYPDLVEVATRYRVMVGFPDGTFRGPEMLTRYQYAQAISQTLPLIRELIVRTDDVKGVQQQAAAAPRRYRGTHPVEAAGQAGLVTGGPQLALAGRYVGYPGNAFLLADAQLRALTRGGAEVELAGFPWVPMLGELQLQPYVGLRGSWDLDQGIGPEAGLLLHWHPTGSPLAFTVRGGAQTTSNSFGQLAAHAEAGAEYHPGGPLAYTAGLGLRQHVRLGVPETTLGLTAGLLIAF